MRGRIKRKQDQARPSLWPSDSEADPVCPLCGRAIPKAQRDAHHLLPKSRGGVDTVVLHRICHRQIHALLSEVELERHFQSVEALRMYPELARFLQWVRNKPDDFYERTRKSQRLKNN
jgi:hypothetical protein